MYYAFPDSIGADNYQRAVAFCLDNDIKPKAVIFGSIFEVTQANEIVTHEFELKDNGTRVWHNGCCGSTHYAKKFGRYRVKQRPETYGFTPLLDASGEVAP